MKHIYHVFYFSGKKAYFYDGKGFTDYIGHARCYSSEAKAKKIISQLKKEKYYKNVDLSIGALPVY